MLSSGNNRRILESFADLLSFPAGGLAASLCEAEVLAADYDSEAPAALGRFRSFVQAAAPGRLEEIFSETFDLDPVCHPYVGAHLFGESYKRSVFIVKLREHYRASGQADSRELPDHLALILRFLAVCAEPEFAAELAREAVLPALEKMAGVGVPAQSETGTGHAENGAERDPERAVYLYVIRALSLVLGRLYPASVEQNARRVEG